MRVDDLTLKALRSQMLQKYSENEYVTIAAQKFAGMVGVGAAPGAWKQFGPYWPVVQEVLQKHQPALAQDMAEWGEPPDYLEHYRHDNEMLDCIAALLYLNRDGDYLSPHGQPHSIEMPDGAIALYSPGEGIIET